MKDHGKILTLVCAAAIVEGLLLAGITVPSAGTKRVIPEVSGFKDPIDRASITNGVTVWVQSRDGVLEGKVVMRLGDYVKVNFGGFDLRQHVGSVVAIVPNPNRP